MTLALGCRHDVERRIGAHLFGICANNSGSTFLKAALATSRATFNRVFRAHEDLLAWFGYRIMDAAA